MIKHLSALTLGSILLFAPPVYAQAEDPKEITQIAEDFFEALAAEDGASAIGLLTEDSKVHAPYNPNGDSSDSAIRSFPAALYIHGAIQTYDNLVWVDKMYSAADDGQTLWIEAQGRLTVASKGMPYHNRYVFKITFDGDKISSITEYTNVATLARDGVVASAP